MVTQITQPAVRATLAVTHQKAGASPAPTIGNIIGAYESRVAVRILKIHQKNNQIMGKLWHRNYYEHIIRNERELNLIQSYIQLNPENWGKDIYFPEHQVKYPKDELETILTGKFNRGKE